MKWLFYFITLLTYHSLQAQAPDSLRNPAVMSHVSQDSSKRILVTSIIITGNKKTKDFIIRREMLFKAGDSIKAAELYTLLQESRKLIYNTTLFTSVTVEPTSFVTADQISISVQVKEKWYLYPTPQFQIIDRNVNEWLKKYDGDLNRVNYGIKFAHYNFSGRRDQLRIYALNGYSRNISFTYTSPYSNPSLTEGFSVGASFTENREVSYKTTFNNDILQYNKGGFARKSISVGGSYTKRNGYYRSHIFSIGYSYSEIADSIISSKYNTNYFNSENPSQHIPDISYTYQYIKVDNVVYPLEGLSKALTFSKRGVGFTGGINAFSTEGQLNKFHDHGSNWYSSIHLSGKIRLPFKVAYINQRAFGFADYYLRGLEYYVIDAVASSLFRYTLKKKIADFTFRTPFKKSRIIAAIPFKIFATTYADAGYAYNKPPATSMLNNRFLYTGGFGLDILTLYDINFRLQYSFNQLNQNGLFLQTKGGF